MTLKDCHSECCNSEIKSCVNGWRCCLCQNILASNEIILDEKETESCKYDSDKLRYDLIDPTMIEELAKVLTYGANKYCDNGWQNLDNFEDRYYAAMMRHIQAWRSGECIDKESGLSHLSHALTNIAFLIYNQNKNE